MHASLSLFVAALVGSAVANSIPKDAWVGKAPWATGSTTTSTPIPSSSAWSTKSPTPTSSALSKPPLGTGHVSHPPIPSTTTEVLTSFTTTTVCPIIYTRWHQSSAEIITSYTTSTLTVTSCKSGCGYHPTSYPIPPKSNATIPTPPTVKPTHPGGSKTLTTLYPTTVTSLYTKFVPCSTPVATSSGTTYYSTWLTATAIRTSYVSICTDIYTIAPTKTPVVPIAPVSPSKTPVSPAVPFIPVPAVPFIPVAPLNTCPPAKTVTVTITAGAQPTPPPPMDCKSCYEVHTLTLTNGRTSVITIINTEPAESTTTPHTKPTKSTKTAPTGTGKPLPPKPTVSGSARTSGAPYGTGSIKWTKPSLSPVKVW